jgi:hypothetical protein
MELQYPKTVVEQTVLLDQRLRKGNMNKKKETMFNNELIDRTEGQIESKPNRHDHGK